MSRRSPMSKAAHGWHAALAAAKAAAAKTPTTPKRAWARLKGSLAAKGSLEALAAKDTLDAYVAGVDADRSRSKYSLEADSLDAWGGFLTNTTYDDPGARTDLYSSSGSSAGSAAEGDSLDKFLDDASVWRAYACEDRLAAAHV